MKSRERRERGLGKGMLLLLSILMTGVVFAQSYEKSSKITKSFYATEETEIQISNKYGNIHVIPWEKDSVKFEIILSVRANKESKVDKLFDNVDFDFTSTRYYVIAKTAFHKNTFFKDVSNQIFSGDNNIQVDYYVNIPAQCKIIIDNKFGNIYSTDHHGEVDIKLSNGDLKVNDLHQDAKISVEFGNTYINSMNSGSLKIYYGDLELESADDLQFEGKSANDICYSWCGIESWRLYGKNYTQSCVGSISIVVPQNHLLYPHMHHFIPLNESLKVVSDINRTNTCRRPGKD